MEDAARREEVWAVLATYLVVSWKRRRPVHELIPGRVQGAAKRCAHLNGLSESPPAESQVQPKG